MKNLKQSSNQWRFVGNTTNPKQHRWDEYRNPITGESTLEIHTLIKTSSFDTCDHYYEVTSDGQNFQCKKCGLGHRIAPNQALKDGKIVPIK